MSDVKDILNDPIGGKPEERPDDRYIRAKQGWDDRLGQTVVQTKNWRLAFFGVLSIAMGLTGGIIYLSARSEVEPVVITLDKETGVTNVVGRPSMSVYQPQQNEIRFTLKNFLRMVRTVPLDPVVIKQNWTEAYSYLRQSAANKLNEWARQPESPLQQIGRETVTIQVESVLPITETSYEARWKESEYLKEGSLKSATTYTATFNIEVEPPATEDAIYKNPLGIYIKDFEWHRDMTSAGTNGH